MITPPKKRPKVSSPLTFTEYGVIMLANILHSKKAKQTTIGVVRAFVALKQYLNHNKELADKLQQLEQRYQRQFQDIHQAINFLIKESTDQK